VSGDVSVGRGRAATSVGMQVDYVGVRR
jgi:hypothetical protein